MIRFVALASSLVLACSDPLEVSTSLVPTRVQTPGLTQDEPQVCPQEPLGISSGEHAPYALLATDDVLAWTARRGEATELRLWHRSSNQVNTLAVRNAQVGALALVGRRVVFAEREPLEDDPGRVVAVSLDDGNVTVLAHGTAADVIDEFSIAADAEAQTVYWLTHAVARGEQSVWRLGHHVRHAERIATVQVDMDQTISRMVKDGDELYWALPGGWLYRVATKGGTATLLVDELDGIGGWDVRGGVVAYADRAAGSVHLFEANSAPVILLKDAGARSALALTGERVYYATSTEVRAITRDGSFREQIADASSVGGIAIDAGAVFWGETRLDDGAVSWRCESTLPVDPVQCPEGTVAVKDFCVTASWPTPPTVSATNVYELRFWKASVGAEGPYADPSSSIVASLWMPAHGHGSTAPVVTRTSEGVYRVSAVNFPMSGQWELRHELVDGGAVSARFRLDVRVP